jgi:hypothetical protein
MTTTLTTTEPATMDPETTALIVRLRNDAKNEMVPYQTRCALYLAVAEIERLSAERLAKGAKSPLPENTR